jgi:hypothetical protein
VPVGRRRFAGHFGADVPRTASYRGEQVNSPRLRGVFPNNVEVGNRVLEEGRFFTEQENLHCAPVVVLGASAAQALFPHRRGASARKCSSTATS